MPSPIMQRFGWGLLVWIPFDLNECAKEGLKKKKSEP